MLDALCPIVFDRTMDNANLVGACREVGSATRKGRTLRSSQGCSAPLFPTFARKENMSRIRTIKPEFFTSEDIVSLTPLARLFYVSLWCEADREGRFEWKPKTLKMRYLPADDCDVSLLCDELVNAGMVELYEVDGRVYAVIPGFTRHQVINNREQPSDIPEPPQKTDACVTRESGRKEGREGKGKEDASRDDADSRADVAAATEVKATRIGLLCKRIRQEAKLQGVNPHDPMLRALLDAGYGDDEIFEVCREAVDKGKSWPWASKVIQARKDDAAKVQQSAVSARSTMFKGGI